MIGYIGNIQCSSCDRTMCISEDHKALYCGNDACAAYGKFYERPFVELSRELKAQSEGYAILWLRPSPENIPPEYQGIDWAGNGFDPERREYFVVLRGRQFFGRSPLRPEQEIKAAIAAA